MREFFEELGKKLGETADTVSAKAGEVLEVQKIRTQIRTMERSNERDYQDMGKIIYEKFKNGDVVDTALTAICDVIAQREEEIAEMEKQAAEVQGSTVCDTCKKYVEKGLAYCPHCGERIKETVRDVAEEVKETVKDAEEDIADAAKDVVDAAGEFVDKAE